jgi:HAD superfamily hydrolase (TIGR01509 family)
VKPGERIFREVMKRERAEPGCFTLLDDTAENIVTARILGWRTVKVERNRFEPEKLSVEG